MLDKSLTECYLTQQPRIPCEKTVITKSGWGGYRPNSGGARKGAGRKPKSPIRPPAPDRLRWYCIRTAYNAEDHVAEDVTRAGFEVFYPLLWIPPTLARRTETGRSIPARTDYTTPLFRRYLFVRFMRSETKWHDIAHIRGVDCIFGQSPTNPTAVPDADIELIRKLCTGDTVYPPLVPTLEPIPVGTAITVTDGPFLSRAGFCEWSDGERVTVLLSIMGGKVPVTVDRAAVEVACA